MRVLFVLAFVLSANFLRAQIPLSQMYHRGWTVRDGAPNNIEDIKQGPAGFLWLTTDDGLYRFDGVRFERYHPPAGLTLLSDRLNTVTVAPDGSLWLSYMLGGVTRIKGAQLTNFTENDGLHSGHIGKIVPDEDGRVWIVGTNGLQYIRDSHVTQFHGEHGEGDGNGESAALDSEGNLWSSQGDMLWLLEHGTDAFVKASTGHFYGCTKAHEAGVLCRNLSHNLAHFTVTHSKVVSRPITKASSDLYDSLAASDGTIWMGTEKNGIQRVMTESDSPKGHDNSSLESFGLQEGLTGERAANIIQDREGSIWVVTDRGLDQFRIVPFRTEGQTRLEPALPARSSGGKFFIASDRLVDATSGMLVPLTPPREHADAIRSLFSDDDGAVWTGSSQGLWKYKNGKDQPVPLPADIVGDWRMVQTIAEDSSHKIWAAIGGKGLYRLDEHGWTKRGGYVGLPDTTAYAALRDSRGDLWFGFLKGVLARITGSTVTVFNPSNGLDFGDIKALTEHDGKLWIGGERGVFVFDQGKFSPLVLSDSGGVKGVTGLAFTTDGDLWINSSSGVFQVVREQLERRNANAGYHLQWRGFDYLDGLEGLPFPTYANTAAFAPNGRLYISTNQRLQWIDPLRVPTNTLVPQVLVTNVKIGSRDIDPSSSSSLRLTPDAKNLEIRYTATSLLIPERVRFRYRLEGFDSDWIDAGTRRQAFYSKLPAGRYTFHVLACNNSGVWSPAGASLIMIVPPTFRETVWFKLVVLLGVALLLVLLFRFRMQQVKQGITSRLYERFAERERIARDLHDSLFQGVEGSLLLISSVTSRMTMDPAAKKQLQHAFHEANQVMASGRGLIYDLRMPAESLDFEGMVATYGQQAGQLSEATFEVTFEGTKRELKTAVFEELQKMTKEGVHNAFLHSKAAHIQVCVSYSRTGIDVSVADDGIGIDPVILERGGRPGHWGMAGMRERAFQLGATLKMVRREPRGTEVRVSLSAARAFRSRGSDLFSRWFTTRL